MSEPSDDTDLRREKLTLEIRALRWPFRSNPAVWISCATAIGAFLFGMFSLRYSRNEWVLSQIEKNKAEEETEKLKSQKQTLANDNQRLTGEKQRLSADVQAMSKQRSELASLLRNADSLLGRAQGGADPSLRSDIARLRETTNPTSALWLSLLSEASKPQIQEAAQSDRLLRDAVQRLMAAYSEISSKELDGFQTSQTGAGPDFKNRRYDVDLAFVRPGYQQPKVYTKYRVRIDGDTLKFLTLNGDEETRFYETPAAHPIYERDFKEAVKLAAGPQLKTELDRSE